MSIFATDPQISGRDITGVQRMVSQAIIELRTFRDELETT